MRHAMAVLLTTALASCATGEEVSLAGKNPTRGSAQTPEENTASLASNEAQGVLLIGGNATLPGSFGPPSTVPTASVEFDTRSGPPGATSSTLASSPESGAASVQVTAAAPIYGANRALPSAGTPASSPPLAAGVGRGAPAMTTNAGVASASISIATAGPGLSTAGGAAPPGLHGALPETAKVMSVTVSLGGAGPPQGPAGTAAGLAATGSVGGGRGTAGAMSIVASSGVSPPGLGGASPPLATTAGVTIRTSNLGATAASAGVGAIVASGSHPGLGGSSPPVPAASQVAVAVGLDVGKGPAANTGLMATVNLRAGGNALPKVAPPVSATVAAGVLGAPSALLGAGAGQVEALARGPGQGLGNDGAPRANGKPPGGG